MATPISSLAVAITAELNHLIGQPLTDLWRAANMQIFGFGPRQLVVNRQGEEIEAAAIRLHIQCPWRFVSTDAILFASGDIHDPAEADTSPDEFDWDDGESVLDFRVRTWIDHHRDNPPQVAKASGDGYGGFRIEFDDGTALECIPCDSRNGEFSEHWRLFGHRSDESHFVITGDGVEA